MVALFLFTLSVSFSQAKTSELARIENLVIETTLGYGEDAKLGARDLLVLIQTKVMPVLSHQAKEAGLNFELFRPILTVTPDCGFHGFSKGVRDMCIQPEHFWTLNGRRLIVHELFHLFQNFFGVNEEGEEAWLREGLAMVFEMMIFRGQAGARGIGPAIALESFMTSLEGDEKEFRDPQFGQEQYGHSYWYVYYLMTHCGGKEIFWKLARGIPNEFGGKMIDSLLKAEKLEYAECKDFSESAISFEVARVHHQNVDPAFSNANQFTLVPSALNAERFRSGIENLHSFESLPRFSIVILRVSENPSILNSLILSRRIRTFWLQSRVPFAVLEKDPNPKSIQEKEWRKVIVKVN